MGSGRTMRLPACPNGVVPMTVAQSLEQLAIDTIRTLSIDAVQKANSGHPGAPMGAAPMAYVLWTRFLRHAPDATRTGRIATASSCPPATRRCSSTRSST